MDKRPKRELYIAPILNWAKQNKQHTNRTNLRLMRAMAGDAETEVKQQPFKVPSEFEGKDYITMLLHIDAEIEHGLMLQYLYSAYSIGGAQVPSEYREKVRDWQSLILGIAKEEMGHFISVQNVLKVIGAPLNFGRESYPWDTPFYPFPFTLEKFTLDALAKYVYAEAPAEWLESDDPIAKEVVERVGASVNDPHTVGALFKILLQLINDPKVIPDDAFQATTYPYQAKFDEWGRSYAGGNRGVDTGKNFTAAPNVLVVPLQSRDDAFSALSQIAEQGEGEEEKDAEKSHFVRFLHIYKEFRKIKEEHPEFEPAHEVATNPFVYIPHDHDDQPVDANEADGMITDEKESAITNEVTALWANLFNLRYRMLLNYLNHSFLIDHGFNNPGSNSPRGMIINSTFGEMYNLRSIATLLVEAPLKKNKKDKRKAGPPFTVPFTLDLPFGEHNRWRMHLDVLKAANNLIEKLKKADKPRLHFLNALQEADHKFIESISHLTEPATI